PAAFRFIAARRIEAPVTRAQDLDRFHALIIDLAARIALVHRGETEQLQLILPLPQRNHTAHQPVSHRTERARVEIPQQPHLTRLRRTVPLEERDQNCILVAEVNVEGAAAYPRDGRDLVYRGAADAGSQEAEHRRLL